MKLRFWGVRGSIPAPSRATVEFGGNTSCVCAVLGGDHHVIFDAGTGIRLLGQALMEKHPRPGVDLFLSHVHWDHIQGFPFFQPGYTEGFRINVYGSGRADASLRQILAGQMRGPNFPVTLGDLAAQITYRDLSPGHVVELRALDGRVLGQVRHTAGNHPNGVLLYRLTDASTRGSVVYATDTEHYPEGMDRNLEELARGADMLVYDGMYTPREYEEKYRGWGHSTWEKGLEVARSAGVGRLVVFHHDPGHDDAFLLGLEEEVRAMARSGGRPVEVDFAREDMEISV